MKSISSLSVIILIIMNNIMVNGSECLPNGCFYDLSGDLTKKIECKADGRLEILNFHGNNGCENEEFYLSHLTYNSPVENVCCEQPDEQAPLFCRDSFGCPHDQYCKAGECEDNPCPKREELGWFCEYDNECDDCQCKKKQESLEGKCIPYNANEDEEELESSPYTLTVINKSGGNANIGLFETNPSPTDALLTEGYPVVFASKYAETGTGDATVQFQWALDWGLSWLDGAINKCQKVTDDIIYTRTGKIIPVSPGNPTNNGAKLTYDNGVWPDGTYDMSASPNANLQGHAVQFVTDSTFTVPEADSDCLSLCVTLNGGAVFVIDGEPSTPYIFELTPTYYLSTILSKVGETVSATAISESYQVIFGDNTHITVCLGEDNKFSPC